MRLGVLGGTFDPPHIGHLILGESAREQLELDSVLFIPAGVQWRKAGRAISGVAHRVEMARLAIDDNPAFGLSAMEAERPGPSYTADTLEELAERHPAAELYLILGQDALEDLPNWRRPERILELAWIAVASREVKDPLAREGHPLTGLSARLIRIHMPVVQVSASDIRERVRMGRSIRYLVPPAVEAYIRQHGLYGAGRP